MYVVFTLVALLLLIGVLAAATNKPLPRVVQSGVTGLLVGGVYALVALGIVVINKASGVFNFAHGGIMMVGAFIFLTLFTSVSVALPVALGFALITVLLVLTSAGWRELLKPVNLGVGAVTVTALTLLLWQGNPDNDTITTLQKVIRGVVGGAMGAVVLGLAVERFTIRPLIGQPLFASVMVTLALSLVLNGVTQLVWGSTPNTLMLFTETNQLNMEQRVGPLPIELAPDFTIRIERTRLYAFGLALVSFGAFWLFFQYTTAGLAMRAISENQTLSQSLGLRVRVILAAAWAIASLLAMVAATLQASSTSLDANMQYLALRAFPAVLLGGIESIGGALVGGLAIGLTEEYAKLFFSGDVGEQLAPYIVLMIVVILRPEGLFGQKRIDRI
jgi:branched-chain amino acid transport system permease protein